ncbi:MAG: fused MFS/spermidine synthase, partial [Planctomycetota bacterium]
MTPRSRAGLVLLAAAVGGAGTMMIELAAVRLLAPWYGTSLVVWTNVIATILLALALGYLAGGRLSRRGSPAVRLGTALALGAAATALLPLLAPRVAGAFLPAGLALEEAAEIVLWGSLAASLVLFLPPAFLLGMVAPLAVEAVQAARGSAAGQAGGAVLGTSTLGSLAGVFATSHLLLPALGLARTFLLAAALLAAAGIATLLLARGGARRASPPILHAR